MHSTQQVMVVLLAQVVIMQVQQILHLIQVSAVNMKFKLDQNGLPKARHVHGPAYGFKNNHVMRLVH